MSPFPLASARDRRGPSHLPDAINWVTGFRITNVAPPLSNSNWMGRRFRIIWDSKRGHLNSPHSTPQSRGAAVGRLKTWPAGHGWRATKKERTKMKKILQQFVQDESGQDLIEYTLLLAFVALASASLFLSAGNSVTSIWQAGSTQLSNAAVSAS